MGRISFRSALSMLSAFLFLTFGSLSVSAQYYMNVFQNDGQKFHFVVANIDSVSFTDQTGLTDNEEENKYEFVDLGLSVNWATRNVGASSFEKYGDYFAWGETSVKNSYSWSNYKFCHGTDVTQTKYCTNGNFGYNGVTDNKSILDLDDDVAQVNWVTVGVCLPVANFWNYRHTVRGPGPLLMGLKVTRLLEIRKDTLTASFFCLLRVTVMVL